jgi:hypothetical protein
MTIPLAPVIHTNPSLANGSGDSLDKTMIIGSGEHAVLVEFRTAVRRVQEERLAFLLSDGLMEIIEPLAGGQSEGITVEPLQGRRRILSHVGRGVLLTFGTRKNTREILKKDVHVGGLVRIYDGTTGRTDPFGKKMKIGPEGGTPLGGFLNQEGRNHLGAGGAFATTITGHGLTMVWVIWL